MKGEVINEQAVRFVRALPESSAKVWAFLTDSARLPEWYGEGSIEPREGGAVTLMGGHVRGVVTGWRPEEFLAYTWNVFAPGETPASSSEAAGQSKKSNWPVSYLEFELAPEDGGTRLVLIHRPVPQKMQAQTMMGWHTMLDLIEAGCRGEFPRRADLFPANAALYGVDINNLKKV
jgi:uncharacterized protein YndB with AHSA1/START domain